MDIGGVTNSTTEFSWVPNPTARGSSNILQTCLLTIGLCVWTAVHLNIPEDDDDKAAKPWLGVSRQNWRKVGWVFIGLFAPEMLIYTAWYQRSVAREFVREYNKVFGLEIPKSWRGATKPDAAAKLEEAKTEPVLLDPRQRKPWTLVHGFYASMGGFALDTTFAQDSYCIPRGRVRVNIQTFKELLDLTQKEAHEREKYAREKREWDEEEEKERTGQRESVQEIMIDEEEQTPTDNEDQPPSPDMRQAPPPQEVPTEFSDLTTNLNISPADLADKSKANGMAKALVCLQALWFCIQCLARVAQGLPLSLLELNTVAHALCALTVYVLWWHKPLDIGRPTALPVDGRANVRLWAQLWRYEVGKEGFCFECLSGRSRVSNAGFLARVMPSFFRTEEEGGRSIYLQPMREVTVARGDVGPLFHACNATLAPNTTPIPGIFTLLFANPFIGLWWPTSPNPDPSLASFLSFRNTPAPGRFAGAWTSALLTPCTHAASRARSFHRAENFPPFDIEKPWVQFLFVVVAFLYGGFHALGAWRSAFPSYAQQLLWRISSCVVMGAGVPVVVCYFLLGVVQVRVKLKGRARAGYYDARRWRTWVVRLWVWLGRAWRPEGLLGRAHVEVPGAGGQVWGWIVMDNVLQGIMLFCLPLYVLARGYIVVDCFVQLCFLPPGKMFVQPVWSGYVPHLG
ncbi:hypothetical protein B0T22DRAFT_490553 [Podospora appendiculata]|uniref:Uncharacterized protein n=1 Tax=Podospora appendiculata TaxID=314037 RepID=A0AAE0XAQ4_9PEZI|nr:hypothetical protein B0T22DRAFT_490553 [Podospora appendiculata]